MSYNDILKLEFELQQRNNEIHELQEKILQASLNEDSFKDNDEKSFIPHRPAQVCTYDDSIPFPGKFYQHNYKNFPIKVSAIFVDNDENQAKFAIM